MGSVDRADDRTFKTNFTADGVAMLRERVNEKLKEFMGDYTDDTLVEYVIVLLKNGRRKEQAKNELDVFLGDDSDSFVTWLWDHLALNIDLYIQPEEFQDDTPKRKIVSEVQVGGDGFQHLNSQKERVKSSKLPRSRHDKDWKGLVGGGTEPPPLQSSAVDNIHLEEKTRSEVNHGPRSPPRVQRKRGRADEQQKAKRDAVSQVTIDAPRRLLQFAVRDAVATSRSSSLGTPVEPSLKRLRSVVSTSSGDSSSLERPQQMQPVSREPNPMATVIKAVAEAAEDVVKFKSSRSVFDRLGRGTDPLDGRSLLEDNYQGQEQNQSLYLQRNDYDGPYTANVTMLEHESGFPSDLASDNEGFDDVDVMGRRVSGPPRFGSSSENRGDDLLMLRYSVAKNAEDGMQQKRNRDQKRPAAAPNPSHKIVNIALNVNTWKPPQYQEPMTELDGHASLDSKTGAPRSGQRLLKEKANTVKISNGNRESQKAQLSTSGGSSAARRPLEDADSRTIFASNVHFAATKDGLSRHFNKFGEVLKVVIVTDAATGQPKGAAYVEFMRKEAADNALSLDGTSFMSRILKVVRKSAAHQESAPIMPWPRVVRGSVFPSARFPRAPHPRGIPGAFRPWSPFKPGSRSLQWKREDAQGTPSDNGASLNNSCISAPVTRSLTYVRTESKLEGSLSST